MQAFVRALKAPQDPPPQSQSYSERKYKIDIARDVWDDAAFHVPQKAEFIVDWILTQLWKDRNSERPVNPLVDARYWTLLADILHSPSVRPLKLWLLPTLQATPIAPLLTATLQLLRMESPQFILDHTSCTRRVLERVWPLSSAKFSPESLLECFACALGLLSHLANTDDNLSQVNFDDMVYLTRLISSGLGDTFTNASNKKKIRTSFIQDGITPWLSFLRVSSPSLDDASLDVYRTGETILFPSELFVNIRSAEKGTISSGLEKELDAMFHHPSRRLLLPLLPRLFQSFCKACSENRAVLSASGTSPQAIMMTYFSVCEKFLRQLGQGEDDEAETDAWTARASLLQLYEKEGLNKMRDDTEAGAFAMEMLKETAAAAAARLESSRSGSTKGLLTVVIQCLSALSSIDHDALVAPLLSSILPSLILIKSTSPEDPSPPVDSPTFALSSSIRAHLSSIISHHSKTRTLPILIGTIISSLSSNLSARISSQIVNNAIADVHFVYVDALSSVALSPVVLDGLAQAVRSYCPPGEQTSSVLRTICSSLSEAINSVFSISLGAGAVADNQRPKKRRKLSPTTSENETRENAADVAAFILAILSRVSHAVLPCIIIQKSFSDEEGVLGEVREAVSRARKMALVVDEGGIDGLEESWSRQVGMTAVLRLAELFPETTREVEHSFDQLVPRIRSHQDTYLPELVVETFQTILRRISNHSLSSASPADGQGHAHIHALIQYLDTNLPHEGGESYTKDTLSWTGASSHLNTMKKESPRGYDHQQSALALVYLVHDRWLPILNSVLTKSELRSLLRHLILTQSPMATTPGINRSYIACRVLASAEFWELSSVRAELLSILDERTSTLRNVDLDEALQLFSEGKKNSSLSTFLSASVESTIGMYRLLLTAPPDYVHRSSCLELVQRAIIADVAISSSYGENGTENGTSLADWLAILRTFVYRAMLHYAWQFTLAPSFITYLLQPRSPSSMDNHTTFVVATIKLAETASKGYLREASRGTEESLLRVLDLLNTSEWASNLQGSPQLAEEFAICFVDVATSNKDFAATEYSLDLRHQLGLLSDRLLHTTTSGLDKSAVVNDLAAVTRIAKAWLKHLALRQWLSSEKNELLLPQTENLFGALARAHVLREGEAERQSAMFGNAALAVFAVASKELQVFQEPDSLAHLQLFLAAYLSIRRSDNTDASLDDIVRQTSSTLSPGHYGRLLTLAVDLITSGREVDLVHTIHFLTIMLPNPPERATKLSQTHFTQVLRTFLTNPVFFDGHVDLRVEVLSCVTRHCLDRPATVTAKDTATIWVLMSQYLHGADVHDSTTTTKIFHELVSMTGALIRHRRDLVTTTLPLFGVILRNLLSLLKRPRPQLGTKQARIVSNTFPRWINPAQPLTATEAKGLARLLVSLTAKTLVRHWGTFEPGQHQQEQPKAESLAWVFSKHAGYVLTSYIDLMNDPFCVLPLDIRKELEPGLFALCDSITDHGRDAIMVASLDAGGKVVMKALWKEYEKQRYVGKG